MALEIKNNSVYLYNKIITVPTRSGATGGLSCLKMNGMKRAYNFNLKYKHISTH